MPEPTTNLWTWARHHLLLSNSRQAWEDRFGLFTLVAGAVSLYFFGSELALSRQVLLWGLLFGVLAVLLRNGWLRLFGPVLGFELVMVSRRGRYFLMRLLYILGLSLLLAQFYWSYWIRLQFTEGGKILLKEQAQFAEAFFYTFMWVQFLATVLLTPAYTASAIADEKDRKTLEFLLATDLHNREIVLGKWLARVGNLALLVIGGIPILAINLFMGGVDPDLMVAGFVATLLTLFGLAGVSILTSVYAKRARDAIVLSYLLVMTYYALSTTLTVLAMSWSAFGSLGIYLGEWSLTVLEVSHWLSSGNIFVQLFNLFRSTFGAGLTSALPETLRDYAIFHGLLTLTTVSLAVGRLRQVALKQQAVLAPKRGLRLRHRAGVGNYPPMLWKEVFADGGQRMNVAGKIVLLLLIAVSFVPLILIIYWYLDGSFTGGDWNRFTEAVNYWTAIAGMLVACLTLLGVGVRAAGSISGERDKQTYDSLLTTPLTSNEMLWGKWLGSLTGMRWGFAWVCLIWGIGAALIALHPVLLVLLVGAWFIYAGVIALIGLWFSMVSKTSLRATMYTVMTTIGCAIGHWVLWSCCIPFIMFMDRVGQVPEDLFQVIAKVQMGLSPPLVFVWLLPWRWQDFGQTNWRRSAEVAPEVMIAYALLGLVIWALAGAGLWVLLSRRFQKLTGRESRMPERRTPVRRGEAAKPA